MRKILFLAAMLWSAHAYAFDMNVTRDDLTRVQNGYLVGDLMVGDKAYIGTSGFCSKNNKLFLVKNGSTGKKSEYFMSLVVHIIPNNMVEVSIQKDMDFDKFDNSSLYVIPNDRPCETLTAYYPNIDFYAVKSLQGYGNMRDYIGFLKDAGFDVKADLN